MRLENEKDVERLPTWLKPLYGLVSILSTFQPTVIVFKEVHSYGLVGVFDASAKDAIV
jgi:hypothetical protein